MQQLWWFVTLGWHTLRCTSKSTWMGKMLCKRLSTLTRPCCSRYESSLLLKPSLNTCILLLRSTKLHLCETAFQCIFFVILRNYGCYRSWKHLTSIVNEGGKPLNKWRCFDERRRCLTFCRTILLTGLWRSDGDKILLCTGATQFLNWDLANLI